MLTGQDERQQMFSEGEDTAPTEEKGRTQIKGLTYINKAIYIELQTKDNY